MKLRSAMGIGSITCLIIKRDRLRLTLWILGIAFLTMSLTATFKNVFTDDAELISMITMFMANPAMRVFLAPASGVSLGGFIMMRSSTVIAVLIALFSILTIIRHTRQNEEIGRSDMMGSLAVGRHAGLLASVIVTVCSNLLIALLLAGTFIGFGLPAEGALAAGAALGMMGIAFTGLAAICAQLAESSRGANGLGGLVIGASFLFSAIGNMLGTLEAGGTQLSSTWPVWLSPFGWYQQVHAFHQNNSWMIVIPAVCFIICLIVALKLENHRDVGAGMIPAGRGPERAAAYLLKPAGLAFRLQRSSLFIWLAVMAVLGVIFGLSSGEFNEAISDLDRADEIFGDVFDMDEIFMMIIIAILSSFSIFYTVQAFSRMLSEEKNGFLDNLMATKLSKMKWLISHMLFVYIGTASVIAMTGIAAAVTSAGNPDIRFMKVIESAVIQIPAAFILAGLAMLFFGYLPRWSTSLAWLVLGISLMAGPFLGPALDLPDWIKNLSPFTHVPEPTETIKLMPMAAMSAISVLLTAAGMFGFYNRSLKRQM